MKCHELSAFLGHVDGLAKPGPLHVVLSALKQVLDSQPNLAVSALVKKLAGLSINPPFSEMPHTDLGPLDEWLTFIEMFGKPPIVKDLGALVSVARPHLGHGEGFALAAGEHLSMSRTRRGGSRTEEVREGLVQDFVGRLEHAIGDEVNFKQVMADLARGTTGAEIALIAKQFAGGSPRNRSAATKAIVARHHAVVLSNAKAQTTRGRIAG